jgi:hypothetical protein
MRVSRVTSVTPRPQRGQHRQEVLLHEEHGGDDDVAVGDVVFTTLQRLGIAAPFRRRVHDQAQPWHRGGQRAVGALGRAGEVAVHRDDDHPHGDTRGRGRGASSD